MTNTSFAALKKSRSAQLAKLQENMVKQNKPSFNNDDDMFWQPKQDKAGNSYAVVRFLPAPPGEDLPYARVFKHFFDGPGGKYVNNSLTTIGLKDPVAELNQKLWNEGNEDQARKQKRNLYYYMNVYIIKHPNNPEDEGTVRLFRCGKQIFKKIESMMIPPDDEAEAADFEAIDPFDLWSGANFKLRVRMKGDYKNYEDSTFDAPSQLFEDEGQMESVWKQCHSLQQFLAPEQFKSYDELKTELENVLGSNMSMEDEIPFDKPDEKSTKTAAPKKKAAAKKTVDEDAEDIDKLLQSLED